MTAGTEPDTRAVADDATAWFDLGVRHNEAGRPAAAEAAFKIALEIDPSSAESHLGLGLALMAQRRFAEALPALGQAAGSTAAPNAWRLCHAQCGYLAGRFALSAAAFEEAARHEPIGANAEAVHARARLNAALIAAPSFQILDDFQNRTDASDAQMLSIAEETFSLLAGFGHTTAAACVGRWRLARGGPDLVLDYRLGILEGRAFERTPAACVTAQFDAFAERFEQHLVEDLGYDAPARLGELLALQGRRFGEAADIGCGTGLALPVLRPMARHVTGVDLSGAMLERAAARGYDRLVQRDAIDFLRQNPAAFDLVFAADVLIYLGELRPFFDAARDALRPGGLLAFSTESCPQGWTLRPSGRFAHADGYVESTARQGFHIRARAAIPLRREGHEILEGGLHILARR